MTNFGLNIFNNKSNNVNLEEFPLNLIPDIQLLLSACLLAYIVILNVKIVQYIIKKDYIKHIPDNGIWKILKIILNRYINIWSKTSNWIVSWCYLCLGFSLFMANFALSFIN